MTSLLVLFYSRDGSVERIAKLIARGINRIDDCEAVVRRVPEVSSVTQAVEPEIPESGYPYAALRDLELCDGLALGSPTRFGNMAAPLKSFLDSTTEIWLSGKLVGKPAACFTSTGSMHGGQESTLLSMMTPLLHHGMVIVGIPFTERELSGTTAGGTPYGASHVAGPTGGKPFTKDEERLCVVLGERLAATAKALKAAKQSSPN